MAKARTNSASGPWRATGNAKAFTLVEVLVVVVIMAIAGAMIVPLMAGAGEMEALSAARVIATDIQYAQNMAITMQTPVTVQFYPDADRYTLSNASGLLKHPMTNKDYLVDFHARDGFDQVDLASASFGGAASVVFDELGSPSAGGSATVLGGSQTYRIDVTSVTGTVSVVNP
jgi:prepilin-type N-terminal cleavage/methylation domain-containing protein